MLLYVVLYYFILLCCVTLCYVILFYYVALCYFNLFYYVVLYYVILFYFYYVALCYVILFYYVVLHYVMLFYYVALCYVILFYYVVLCYIMLYYFNMLLYVLYLSCPVWVQHGGGGGGGGEGGVYLPKAKLAASLADQSVDVLSSRNTGSVSRGRRFNVASGWCTTLRQGGHTNHPPFSLLCCATCYCKSPVQQWVARQQAVNKNNVIHCICHVVAFPSQV